MLVSSMDHLNYYAMQKESSNAASNYHLDPLDATSPSSSNNNNNNNHSSALNSSASSASSSAATSSSSTNAMAAAAAAAVAATVNSGTRSFPTPSVSHLQQNQPLGGHPLMATSMPLRIPSSQQQQQQPPPLVTTLNPNVIGMNLGMLNTDDGSVMPAGSPTYANNEENSPKNGTKSSLYKTELCKRYSEFGSCRYGAKCQFAHGVGELRHVVRHPKYKTTKCKSYWGSGHCPYGSRCRFIHEETEGMQASQYSNANGSYYLRDKDPLGMPSNGNGLMSPPASNGGFMMPGADERGVGSYSKEYYMGSSYDKPSLVLGNDGRSGSKMAFMNGGGNDRPYSNGVRSLNGNAADAAAAGLNGPGYPDLQDAIDALMKFSLSSQENETLLGTISTTPAELPTVANQPPTAKRPTDFSLAADELWKDFSVGTSSLSGGLGTGGESSLQSPQWPMTTSGLSLSLENTVFDPTLPASVSTTSPSLTTSGTTSSTTPSLTPVTTTIDETCASVKKANSESPRLSVFERFH